MQCVSQCAPTNPMDHLVGETGRWMIFSAGLVIVVAAFLLPMQEDLRLTRLERDRTLYREQIETQRIERYREFLNQLASPDTQTIELLAMTQLGMIPADSAAIVMPGQRDDTLLLEAIEPRVEPFEAKIRPRTRLERLFANRDAKIWIIGAGLLAVLYGLMPATKPR
jgi:hypothetical protein